MRILFTSKSYMDKKDRWIDNLFAKALGRHHDVIYYGKKYTIDFDSTIPIPEIIEQYCQKIDLVLCYLGFSFTGMDRVTDIPKVHYLGDYGFAGAGIINCEGYDEYLKFFKYDMVISYNPFVCELLREKKLAPMVRHLPFGVDTYLFYDRGLPKDIDVMANYSRRRSRYPHRKDVNHLIGHMGIRYFTSKVPTRTYIDMMNRSKMLVSSSSLANIMTPKCTETMACGTLLLTDKCIDMESLGYVDGEHLVIYDGMDDLEEKIRYYPKHEDERNEIAKKGMRFVREIYSNDRIIERFTEMVTEDIFDGEVR